MNVCVYECLKTLSGHRGVVNCVDWSPFLLLLGQKIASSSSNTTIKIWDIESHEYECLSTLS